MNTTLAKTQTEKINNSCTNYKDAYKSRHRKFKKLGDWLEKESSTFKDESNLVYKNKPKFNRGEIIKADFGINMGSELSNVHFAIVLNSDDNKWIDNITVLPLTSKPGYRRIPVGNKILQPFNAKKYNKDTYALITQITTISKNKIFENKTRVYCNKNLLKQIDEEIIKFITEK